MPHAAHAVSGSLPVVPAQPQPAPFWTAAAVAVGALLRPEGIT